MVLVPLPSLIDDSLTSNEETRTDLSATGESSRLTDMANTVNTANTADTANTANPRQYPTLIQLL